MAPRRINIGLVGPGLVGKELLKQISQQVRCVLVPAYLFWLPPQ